MTRLLSLFLPVALALVSAATAQTPEAPAGSLAPDRVSVARQLFPDVTPIAGDFEGSERWIVHFSRRSFDLSAFEAAIWSGKPAELVENIVRDLEQRVRADQQGFAREIEALGGQVVTQWWIINACAVDLPQGAIEAVRKFANVELVEPDQVWEPLIKTATNASNHNADLLQSRGLRGAGIATAIMDTGLDEKMGSTSRPHRTFFIDGNLSNTSGPGIGGTRLVANKKIGSMSQDDVHGHGTGVASIVAGGDWGTSTADHGHGYAADIAGYAIANNTAGSSSTTTMTSAWQAIAADKATYGIMTANNSYSGSPDPSNATQKALDVAARTADILICTAAGNNAGRTTASQICVNGLSVGAVNENSFTRASFTSYGTADGQIFPDICANGVSTNMARRDNEGSDYVGSGTSMASPQVCGAATQLRAFNKSLRADEVKAILLATTFKNANAGSTQSNTGPGCGYLKNDEAYETMIRAARRGRDTFTSSRTAVRRTLPVVQGREYQVALAWHRMNENSTTWSNLDLRVLDGSTIVIESKTLRNTEEFVRFTASRTTTLTIEFRATSLAASSQPWAWATNADTGTSSSQPGDYTLFGKSCLGSATIPTPGGHVVPAIARTSFGNSNNYFGVGRGDQHYMQLFSGAEMPPALVITGYSLRHDDAFASTATGTQTYSVYLGYTKNTPATINATYAANWNTSTPRKQVFAGNVNLPAFTNPNTDPNLFGLSVKFPQPFVYTNRSGENFLFELVNTSTTSITKGMDAVSGTGTETSRIYGSPATATTGTVGTNYGLVIRFDAVAGSQRVAPELSNIGVPELGQSFSVRLDQALANSAALLLLGTSNTKWGPLSLPFELSAFGASGCNLLVSWDIVVAVTPTSSTGTASVPIIVPKGKNLVGLRFHNQYVVLDKAANGLGLAWSNGGTGKIGG